MSPEDFKPELLIEPIPGDSPFGRSPRAEGGSFREFRRMRIDANDAETRGNHVPAMWQEVCVEAVRILTEEAKDLEVAVYLVEALTYLRGYAGFADGIDACCLICDAFWDGLFPEHTDLDGDEIRTRSLVQFLGNRGHLHQVVLSANFADPAGEPVSLLQLDRAESAVKRIEQIRNSRVLGEREREEEEQRILASLGGVTRDDLVLAAQQIPDAILKQHLAAIDRALDGISALSDILEERYQTPTNQPHLQRPSVLAMRDVLVDARKRLSAFIKEEEQMAPGGEGNNADADQEQLQLQQQPDSSDGLALNPGDFGPAATLAAASRASAVTRSEVLRALENAAQFFEQTEPHNPAPYLLRRAIHWSNMKLDELLVEIVANPSERATMDSLIGIQRDDDSTA
ncbi:MAG: ImpA family type VI secretion system protein [Planctomycetota bacterium]